MFLLVLHRSVLPPQKLQVKLKVQILYICTNTSYSKRNHKIDKWLGCENASLKIAKQLKLNSESRARSSLSSTPETTGQALPVLLALTESCCLGVWSCLPLGFCLSLYCVTCFLYVNVCVFMFYSLDLLLFLDFLKFAFSVAVRFSSAIAVEWNVNKRNYKTDDWWKQVSKV